jgi:hypothetical protein
MKKIAKSKQTESGVSIKKEAEIQPLSNFDI